MHRPSDPEPFRPTVTRYVDAEGKRCGSKTPGAKKVKTKSRVYVADLYDRGRRERVSLQTTDKGQAYVRLKNLLRERREEDAGLRPRQSEAARPLADHLAEWLGGLLEGGVDEGRVKLMRSRMTLLVELAGWTRLEDIDLDSCKAALAALSRTTAASGACRRRGRSAQTRNHYLQHARQFVRWLWAVKGRLRSNPLAGVKPVSVAGDRRHDRRIAEDWEVARLFAYLEGDGSAAIRRGWQGNVYVEVWHQRPAVLRGMTGPQRALGYRVCLATGLRGKELRRLTPESFDLARETLSVLGKNGKVETLSLPPWLAERLREWLAAPLAGSPPSLWKGFPARHPGRVLQHDLHRAGVAYEVGGKYLDVHALRHWFITTAAHLPGMELRTLMEVARLSSPHLAMRVYSHAKEQRKRDVAAQMPRPEG